MSQDKNKLNIILAHSRPDEVEVFFKENLSGVNVSAVSLVDIKPLDFQLPDTDYYIITSANAVDQLPLGFNKPIIAVGAQTREALAIANIPFEDKVYDTISDLDADMDAYKKSVLCHICATHRSPDSEYLTEKYNILALPVYEAQFISAMPNIIKHSLNESSTLFVLFSARGAQALMSLFTSYMDCAKLMQHKELVGAIAISARVSDSLNHEFLSYVEVAQTPDRHSLLKAIKQKLI